ncbi:hypothetical protein D3C87_1880520 [compost metagenome]
MRLNVVFAQVVGDCRTNVDRHDAHSHIERRQDLSFELLRHVQPRAGKAPGGVRRERWVSEHKQE